MLPDADSPSAGSSRSRTARPCCPQVDVLRVDGSLFFGAVDHVRDELAAMRAERPGARHVLLVGSGINFVDVAGADMLAHEARAMAESGVALHLTNLKAPVRAVLEASGVMEVLGRTRIHIAKADALRAIYAELDVAICEACAARVFNECQTVLPDGRPRDATRPEFALASPEVRAPRDGAPTAKGER